MQDAEQVSAGQPVSVLVSVCREDSYGSDALERCRILPYLIKAAPLRSAAPGRARTGLRPWGPTRHGAPGIMRTIR